MKRGIVLILTGLFLTLGQAAAWQLAACAQINSSGYSYRDPFDSLLPEPSREAPKNPLSGYKNNPVQQAAVPAAKPLSLSIEGILWGTDKPLAIINGVVYKIGDTLKDIDVKLYDIQKNKVLIVYQGRLQEFGVNPKKDETKNIGGHSVYDRSKEGGRKW